MRTIKSRSGLTKGRGMSESVRMLWIYSKYRCSQVHESMTRFTELQHTTNYQHVEIGKSRVQGDIEDLTKISQWFDIYDPFWGKKRACIAFLQILQLPMNLT